MSALCPLLRMVLLQCFATLGKYIVFVNAHILENEPKELIDNITFNQEC